MTFFWVVMFLSLLVFSCIGFYMMGASHEREVMQREKTVSNVSDREWYV